MSKKILVVCDRKERTVSLQQIPNSIKAAFVPAEGHTFIDIDYSQMEYRVAASLSGDTNMIAKLNSDDDFYSSIAADIYKKDISDITKPERDKVKVVSLGVLYGMSANSVAARLSISQDEAQHLITQWKSNFPQLMQFREKTENYIRATGKTPSFFGRYRDFGKPSDLDDEKINEGFNTTIQGCASDLLKISMVMTSKHLASENAGKIKLTLHDELLFEVPDEKVPEIEKSLREIMTTVVKRKPDWCNFKVSINKGKTWAEASK